MARFFSLALMLAATAGFGCGGRAAGTTASGGTTAGGGTTANGGTTVSGGSADTTVSGGSADTTVSGGSAGKKGSVVPVPCTSSSENGGASSSGDTNAPVFHRATAACCPAQRGPAPGASQGSPYSTECSSDSECTNGANGRCFPDEGLVMDSGCSYDECFTDSHCPSLSPCLCRGAAADSTANVCLSGGNCAVDADCGLDGYCSPSPSPPAGHDPGCGYANYAYYCHTKNDTCVNASDCPAAIPPDPQGVTEGWFPVCAYDQKLQRWGCGQDVCLPP